MINQNEHEKLRIKIDEFLKLSNEQLCKYDGIHTKFIEVDANFQKYKHITDDAINDLKNQIECQNTVNDEFFSLNEWRCLDIKHYPKTQISTFRQ